MTNDWKDIAWCLYFRGIIDGFALTDTLRESYR